MNTEPTTQEPAALASGYGTAPASNGATQAVRPSRRGRRLLAAILGTVALLGAGAAMPASASAATLYCRAVMMDSTPTPATSPVLKVTTLGYASVTAVSHFRQGDLSTTATASSTGTAQLTLSPHGLPGGKVVVDVKVRKGTASATCQTSFIPGGVPGSVTSPPPTGTISDTTSATRSASSISKGGLSAETAELSAAAVDPWGGVVNMQFDCYSGDHSIQYGATTSYAPYYRSYRMWAYSYAPDNPSLRGWILLQDWSEAFYGTLDRAARIYPAIDGWYGGFIEVAVWEDYGDYNDWTIYPYEGASHTQQGWAGGGSFPSIYPQRACYASW